MNTQAPDPRTRLRELLSIPERDRTDEQWDEIVELEIQTAPVNRLSNTQPSGGGMGRSNNGGGRSGGGGGRNNGPRNGGPRNGGPRNAGGNSGGSENRPAAGGEAVVASDGTPAAPKNHRPRGGKQRRPPQKKPESEGTS